MTLAARGVTIRATLGGRAVDVLRGIDFAIAPGRVLGLVGESGAGKSMIGRVLARALPQGFAVAGGSLDFTGPTASRPTSSPSPPPISGACWATGSPSSRRSR